MPESLDLSVRLVERPLPASLSSDQEITDRALYAARAVTDAAVVEAEFRDAQLHLSPRIRDGFWQGIKHRGDLAPVGLGRVSLEIGKAVNRCIEPESLFDTLEGRQIPPKQVFEDLVSRRAGGAGGSMITQLLMDTCYPYHAQPDDELIELPPAMPIDAYQVASYRNPVLRPNKYCNDTEYWFSQSLNNPYADKTLVSVEDRAVAYQKFEGNHTALLLRPALLNGVRLQPGSAVNITPSGDDPTFSFGRLTPFNFADPSEAVRQFPDLFIESQEESYRQDMSKGFLPWDFVRALRNFNTLAERSPTSKHPVMSPYRSTEAWRRVLQELDEELHEPSMRRFVRVLQNEQPLALHAADAYVALKQETTPENIRRMEIAQALAIRGRRLFYRVFGEPAFKNAENLVQARDELAISLASAPPAPLM